MSDKISLVEQSTDHHQHPTLPYRWLLFIGICLAVFALVGWFFLSTSTRLDGVKRYFRYRGVSDDYGAVSFAREDASAFALLDDELLHAAFRTATLSHTDGTSLTLTEEISDPALVCRSGRALLWEPGGRELCVLSSGGVLTALQTEQSVLSADLSKSGSLCVLTAGSGSRANLDLYNRDGRLLFRRISKSSYLSACAVSPNGQYVATIALGQEDVSFSSTAQIFYTASEDAPAQLPLGDELIYALTFLDKTTLCAAGEESLFFFSVDGTLLGQYRAAQGRPVAYSLDGDGFVAVCFDLLDAEGYRLVTLDKSGRELASAGLAERPLSLSTNGRYTAVLTEHRLMIYDNYLLLHSQTANTNWLSALVRSDGTAYCLGSDFAKLYIP